MVRAILDGRKTVTRRVLKKQPPDNFVPCPIQDGWSTIWVDEIGKMKVPYPVGEKLYVRETWKTATIDPAGGGYALQDIYLYKADEPIETDGMMVEGQWHPSIHMPRLAARIFLRVNDVRVERLQEITEEGVIDEGAEPLLGCEREHMVFYTRGNPEPCYNYDPCKNCPMFRSYPEMFGEYVWDSTINPKDIDLYGWEANPWVWVIEFERISRKEAEYGKYAT